MRARRTPHTPEVLQLPGGNEDNALPCRSGIGYPDLDPADPCAGMPYTAAVFEPDRGERAAIASGANIELVIIGGGWPPVLLKATREQPLSRPQQSDGPTVWAEFTPDLAEDLVALIGEARLVRPHTRRARLADLKQRLAEAIATMREAAPEPPA